jgi:hypothetical protein
MCAIRGGSGCSSYYSDFGYLALALGSGFSFGIRTRPVGPQYRQTVGHALRPHPSRTGDRRWSCLSTHNVPAPARRSGNSNRLSRVAAPKLMSAFFSTGRRARKMTGRSQTCGAVLPESQVSIYWRIRTVQPLGSLAPGPPAKLCYMTGLADWCLVAVSPYLVVTRALTTGEMQSWHCLAMKQGPVAARPFSAARCLGRISLGKIRW